MGDAVINKRERIVLIACKEDKELNSICVNLLKCCKYRIIKVDNGSEAIKQARTMLPDFILIDMYLPQTDGFTTTKRIREFSPFEQTKIIFLSELNNNEIRDAAIAVGSNEYLIKPLDFSVLQNTLNKYEIA